MAIEGFGGDLGRDDIRKYVEGLKEAMLHMTSQAERIKVGVIASGLHLSRY